ncbi:MAG: serine hydroxymethyltransferase [Candidatus Firestonebacteria bacterium]
MFKGYFENFLKEDDPVIEKYIRKEFERQDTKLQMIASENYTSKAIMAVQGSVLTNKYAEGYPGKRFYEGCEFLDEIESVAINRLKKIFHSEHANVQPHSGSSANMAIYFSILNPGDVLMGMDITCGGHLTHGTEVSFSGKIYKAVSYGVNKNTYLLDYEEIRRLALKYKPKLIICGASAYPRQIDFKKFKEIAEEVKAYLMADIAHITGLIVGKVHPDPVPYCDFIGGTTHKTLRGPRGGFILTKKEFAKRVDAAVFPGLQGGPLMHIIAAKAVAFKEAMTSKFKKYQVNIIRNCKVLADELIKGGFNLITGGTDNHLILIDLRNKRITGRESALSLDEAGITANKNRIPYDPLSSWNTSGIRLGTPAITTRGMGVDEMKEIAELISNVLNDSQSHKVIKAVREKVKILCKKFPVEI